MVWKGTRQIDSLISDSDYVGNMYFFFWSV